MGSTLPFPFRRVTESWGLPLLKTTLVQRTPPLSVTFQGEDDVGLSDFWLRMG